MLSFNGSFEESISLMRQLDWKGGMMESSVRCGSLVRSSALNRIFYGNKQDCKILDRYISLVETPHRLSNYYIFHLIIVSMIAGKKQLHKSKF